ncbi:MAG TPA: MarR family transcriptional regulator [archaeon]|nr:MarR family transcriptional regulator [archaeon]
MGLQNELGLLRSIKNQGHETVLNIVFTGTLLTKEGQKVLRPFGLTEAQFNVLILLKTQSVDGKINQTNLGNMLLVNRSNITGLVDRMEQAGLVRRIDDPEDRRVNYVEMTDAGSQALEKAQNAYFSRVDEVMSTLTEDEDRFLTRMLERVRIQLQNSGKNTI